MTLTHRLLKEDKNKLHFNTFVPYS